MEIKSHYCAKAENRIDYLSWGAVFALLGACLLVFWPVFGASFVNWDDYFNFVSNPHYRGLSFENLRWMFTTFHSGHYIPLTWLTLGFDGALWGLIPLGYHITNLLFHCLNAVLCYFLLWRLFRLSGGDGMGWRGKAAALAGAFFFALHPLRAESVAWITARRDLVSGAFGLAALLAYLPSRRGGGRPRLAAAFFAGAVLSRESMAALAPALLVLDIYPLGRLGPSPKSWLGLESRPVLREKAVFFLIAFFGASMAIVATRSVTFFQSFHELGLSHRLGAFFYGLAFYPWKTLWPSGLAPLYEIPPGFGVLSSPVPAYVVFAAGLGIAAYAARKSFPVLAAGLAFYALLIFPTLGIAQTISLAYDRFSYFSCLPFAAFFGAAAYRALGVDAGKRLVLSLCTAAWLIVLGFSARKQTAIWENSVVLWTHTLEAVKLGPNTSALVNRCQAYYEQRQFEAAVKDCSAAITVDPGLADAYMNRGSAFLGLKATDGASRDFEAALRLEPGNEKARFGLAYASMLAGDHKEAVRRFTQLAASGPFREQALMNRAVSYHGLKRDDLALADLDAVLSSNPNNASAYANRGRLREARGLFAAALADYRAALALNPLHLGAASGNERLGKKLGKKAAPGGS